MLTSEMQGSGQRSTTTEEIARAALARISEHRHRRSESLPVLPRRRMPPGSRGVTNTRRVVVNEHVESMPTLPSFVCGDNTGALAAFDGYAISSPGRRA